MNNIESIEFVPVSTDGVIMKILTEEKESIDTQINIKNCQ